MGVASALSTALTGLTAAETTIEVVGNNLANSNTIGFKASQANFATQFLQTRGLGSAPSATSGGTVPRQIGLGTMVADITPNFIQGTIQISSNPADLAIQGDGFFIVQGNAGEELYTRNGIFKLNSQNQLVGIGGNRVLGFGVDEQFRIQTGTLVPIEIPLGNEQVAVPTSNVYLEGTLLPTGDLADMAEIIETGILGDAQYSYPADTTNATAAVAADVSGSSGVLAAGGTLADGTYTYRIAFADSLYADNPDNEGVLSELISGGPFVAAGANRTVNLSSIPDPAAEDYSYFRVYRSTDGGDYCYIGEAAVGTTTFSDNGLADGAAYNDDTLADFNYSYYVTFWNGSTRESRPSEVIADVDAGVNGRIKLTNLPTLPPGNPDGWTHRRIYRNLSSDDDAFHLVATIDDVDTTETFTDTLSDDTISGNDPLDHDGPKIGYGTLLTDVRVRDGDTYEQVFQEGTLEFTANKGGRQLAPKTLEITSTTTVLDLINFMQQTMGIQTAPGPDPLNPVPADAGSGSDPGGYVVDGRIQFVSNNGVQNALAISLSGLQLTTASGTANVSMPFSSSQTAVGEGASTDFIVYDSLGIPLSVQLTAVMQSRNSSSTTYRWFANSPDNSPTSGVETAVGTGLITFDSEGNFLAATESTVSIDRNAVASISPLEFELDFSQLSGLAASTSSLSISRQDGSAAGTLTSFIVGEDGTIRGVFSNGVTRDLGQIRLARFANPNGLEQKGQNLFAAGVNSGLALEGNPGEQGIGDIIAGAVELSNTDIGTNLIELILASTMYRGNTRVITTAQQMLDELLNLRR